VESTPSDTGVLAVAPTSPTTRSIPICGVHADEHTDCQRPAGERSALSFDQRQVCPPPDVATGQGECAPVKPAPVRIPEPADGREPAVRACPAPRSEAPASTQHQTRREW
jgi:hypothetical protein